jgi:hypothetical protein
MRPGNRRKTPVARQRLERHRKAVGDNPPPAALCTVKDSGSARSRASGPILCDVHVWQSNAGQVSVAHMCSSNVAEWPELPIVPLELCSYACSQRQRLPDSMWQGDRT